MMRQAVTRIAGALLIALVAAPHGALASMTVQVHYAMISATPDKAVGAGNQFFIYGMTQGDEEYDAAISEAHRAGINALHAIPDDAAVVTEDFSTADLTGWTGFNNNCGEGLHCPEHPLEIRFAAGQDAAAEEFFKGLQDAAYGTHDPHENGLILKEGARKVATTGIESIYAPAFYASMAEQGFARCTEKFAARHDCDDGTTWFSMIKDDTVKSDLPITIPLMQLVDETTGAVSGGGLSGGAIAGIAIGGAAVLAGAATAVKVKTSKKVEPTAVKVEPPAGATTEYTATSGKTKGCGSLCGPSEI